MQVSPRPHPSTVGGVHGLSRSRTPKEASILLIEIGARKGTKIRKLFRFFQFSCRRSLASLTRLRECFPCASVPNTKSGHSSGGGGVGMVLYRLAGWVGRGGDWPVSLAGGMATLVGSIADAWLTPSANGVLLWQKYAFSSGIRPLTPPHANSFGGRRGGGAM
jgi:hypothetical protein